MFSGTLRFAVCLALSAFCLSWLCAQSPAPPAVFHAQTTLIQVPVSVHAKNGRTVRGLRAADFHVTVDGRPVKLAAVDFVQSSASADPPRLPAGFHTNLSAGAAAGDHVILLFDFMNLGMSQTGDALYVQRALLRLVNSRLPRDQAIAIYGFMPSLTLLQPFTTDHALISSRIKELTEWLLHPNVFSVANDMRSPVRSSVVLGGTPNTHFLSSDDDEWLTHGYSEYDVYLNERDSTSRMQGIETLIALKSLARLFRDVPGHKTVIWLTGNLRPLGLSLRLLQPPPPAYLMALPVAKMIAAENSPLANNPAQGPHALPSPDSPKTSRMEQVIAMLNDADVSLYPMDLRGVQAPAPEKMAVSTVREMVKSSAKMASLNVMQMMGDRTGGAALVDNDFGPETMRAIRDWSSYYILSFPPPGGNHAKKPKRHSIRVKVAAKDVRVLARHEYIYRPETYLRDDKTVAKDLNWSVQTPVEINAIPLAVTTGQAEAPHEATLGKAKAMLSDVPFQLLIPPDALLHEGPNGAIVDFSIQVVLLNANPLLPSEAYRPTRFKFPLNSRQLAVFRSQDVAYKGKFQGVPGQEYFARIAVRDNLTGKMGTISQRVRISGSQPMRNPLPQKVLRDQPGD